MWRFSDQTATSKFHEVNKKIAESLQSPTVTNSFLELTSKPTIFQVHDVISLLHDFNWKSRMNRSKTRRARRFLRRPCEPSGNFWFLYNLLLLRVQASERRKNKNWNQKCISRQKRLGNQEKPAPKDKNYRGSVWKVEQSCTLMHHKAHHRDDFSSFLHAVDISKERMTSGGSNKIGIWESLVSVCTERLKYPFTSFSFLLRLLFDYFHKKITAENYFSQKRVRKMWNYSSTDSTRKLLSFTSGVRMKNERINGLKFVTQCY